MNNETLTDSVDVYELSRSEAAQSKIAPRQLMYLEARGFLCHELLCLLGGRIEYVSTSRKQFVLKFLERIFPISPICRWYRPENSILEWIGCFNKPETKVYRLTPAEPPITVFFVQYKPEPPLNVPQLDVAHFLQPPFDENYDTNWVRKKLRLGSAETEIYPITPEEIKKLREIRRESNRGLWEEFIK